MKCTTCNYENEADANFCRQCGSKMEIEKPVKGPVEFVPGQQKTRTEDNLCFGEELESGNAGYILGAVFICLGFFIAIVMIFPDAIGNFFGNFGEFFGQLGSDIGNFFGRWGETFGESVGNFFSTLFSESNIWEIIKFLIPCCFIIFGIIVIFVNRRR